MPSKYTEAYKLSEQLEDIGDGPFADDNQVFLCSIAVSLKRIADAFQGDEKNAGLVWLIGELTNRPC